MWIDGPCRIGARWRTVAAALVIVSFLAVATAPVWHHHDEADEAPGAHHNCPVCVMAAEPRGMSIDGSSAVIPLIPEGTLEAVEPNEPAAEAIHGRPLPRGPPVLT